MRSQIRNTYRRIKPLYDLRRKTPQVSVRYPVDEKICPGSVTRDFDSCAFMELAIPDFCFETTDRQWVLLLATTLRQRDEAFREAEASRWEEKNSRQQATFWKTQHRRARKRAEAARNELKRLKSASLVNELGREVGRLRHGENEEATRRDRTRQRPRRATASLFGTSSVARASAPDARGRAARNERAGGVGSDSPARHQVTARSGRLPARLALSFAVGATEGFNVSRTAQACRGPVPDHLEKPLQRP